MRITPLITLGITITLLISTAPLAALTLTYNTATQTYTITFDPQDYSFFTLNNYDIIHLNDGGLLTEPGKPMLPLKNIYIALPPDTTVHTVHLTDITTDTPPHLYTILPTQAPIPLSANTPTPTLNHPTPTYYQTTTYPTTWITLERQFTHAGQNLIHLTIYPVHYNAYTKQLTLAQTMQFTLETTTHPIEPDYLPTRISTHQLDIYETQIQELVINPIDVSLKTDPTPLPSRNIPPGTYDYVIITPDNFYTAYEPLAHWKTQKGVPATIMNLSWIYNSGGYSGTNKEKIRAFIQDAHSTWGAAYFLLGADTPDIPYHEVYYKDDWIPTDAYYGDYDDDWTYEVMIGRASVIGAGTSAGGVGNFVNKILSYEKNPPTSDYAKRIGLFGFDLDQYTDGEDCKIDIDSLYIPSDWSVNTVYDSHTGNHEDNVDAAVNTGQHLINHIDHSGEYFMGTGYTNHNGIGLDTNEVDAFSNGNKQSIWYSIGCWASAFDFSNCIAEHFVRDTDGGGIAFVGNTRYGWYYQGYDDGASLRYDRYFFRSLYEQNHYHLGDLFVDHLHDSFNSMTINNLNKYIFSELTLLGDPELPLWTENPNSIVVTHPDNITLGSTPVTIQVTSGGSAIADATVCLWKDDEVYLIDTTDATGQVTLSPTPSTAGQLHVTVTKHNYIPYEGTITVLSNNQPPVAEAGGPYTGETGLPIAFNGSASYDPDGSIILYEWDFDGDGIFDWSSPSTSITTYSYTGGGSFIARLQVTDNESAQANDTAVVTISGPVNNPPYQPGNPYPSNGSVNLPAELIVSWVGGDPDGNPVTYDVYFGISNPPPHMIANQSTLTYYPGTLEISTTYYWKIVAWDNHSAHTEGPLWHFTTEGGNTPPNPPSITGPSKGRAGITYSYTFICTDPEADTLSLFVDWGDGTDSGWLGPYNSSEIIVLDHTWNEIGSYIVKAKGKDMYDAEGDWGRLTITMPLRTILQHPLLNLLQTIIQHFPLLHQFIFNLIN